MKRNLKSLRFILVFTVILTMFAAETAPVSFASQDLRNDLYTETSPPGGAETEAAVTDIAAGQGSFVPGEVISEADSAEHAEEIAAIYGLTLQSYACGIAVFAAPDPQAAISGSRRMRQAGIQELYLNTVYESPEPEPQPEQSANQLPAAPDTAAQWHHAAMDTGRAWEYTKGEGVVVAVIDSGIDADHPEFQGRLLPNAYNSYTHQIGLEYVQDSHGHGSAVAGVIAARENDGNDICGVAPEADLLIIKAHNPNEQIDNASYLRGINYAVECGADIINLSFGYHYNEGADELEHKTVAAAVSCGITVVCGAGNDRDDHAIYPAAYPGTIAVSALKEGGEFDYSYSNFGPEISISAPGTNIYTTQNGGGYVSEEGTSFATPNVAGVAALIKSLHPDYSPSQVMDALYQGAAAGSPAIRDDYYGYGPLNAYAAVLGPENLIEVTYVLNNGDAPATALIIPGEPLNKPQTPVRDGFIFAGWTSDAAGDREFDFSEPVTEDMTVYAQWADANVSTFISEFPDPAFRAEVLRILNENDGGARRDNDAPTAADTNALASVSDLDVRWLGIYDLSGLAYFSGLTLLYCSHNRLTELDVSALSELATLACNGNRISALDLSNNPKLSTLICPDNTLETLDVSKNDELSILSCYNNQLKQLDVSNHSKLTELECDNNLLKELNLSENKELAVLFCCSNRLSTLNVSENAKLTMLECANNLLKELDLSENKELSWLYCSDNDLTALDLKNNPYLDKLWCDGNCLTALDIAYNPLLQTLQCQNNCLPSEAAITGLENIRNQLISYSYAPQRVPGTKRAETPEFIEHPADLTVTRGKSAVLTVAAEVSDGGTLSCEWFAGKANGVSAGMGENFYPDTSKTGTAYYYAVVTNTRSGVASSSLRSMTAVVIVEPEPGSSGSSGTHGGGGHGGGSSSGVIITPSKDNENASVIVDGTQISAVSVTKTGAVSSVAINQAVFGKLLETAGSGIEIVMPPDSEAGKAQLLVKNIEDMAQKGIDFSLRLGGATYTIPSGVVDTAAVLAMLGVSSSSDVTFNITVSNKVTGLSQTVLEETANVNGVELVCPPAEFTVTASYGNKTVEVKNFKNYVSHTIEFDNEEAEKATTGVVIGPANQIHHTPTRVYRQDGKYYAEINSLTNSVYALVHSEKAFTDTSGTWYEDIVREMSGRLIIAGVGDNMYAGESPVTRAEFSAILVNALGLPDNVNLSVFSDVPAAAWYSGPISAAYEYGLVSGRGEGIFDPGSNITWQEAMTMLKKAAELTGLEGRQISVEAYPDAALLSSWAKDSAWFYIGAGLYIHEGKLRPTEKITRAETAAAVLKLLQVSGLIDVRNVF